MCHQKYSPPFTKVLGFFACRVTSKFLVIGAAERSWGDVKTIKFGKISAISSDVSEKRSIFYTSACIESARIEQYHSENHQLEKWGVEKVFSEHSEPIKIELRAYIED